MRGCWSGDWGSNVGRVREWAGRGATPLGQTPRRCVRRWSPWGRPRRERRPVPWGRRERPGPFQGPRGWRRRAQRPEPCWRQEGRRQGCGGRGGGSHGRTRIRTRLRRVLQCGGGGSGSRSRSLAGIGVEGSGAGAAAAGPAGGEVRGPHRAWPGPRQVWGARRAGVQGEGTTAGAAPGLRREASGRAGEVSAAGAAPGLGREASGWEAVAAGAAPGSGREASWGAGVAERARPRGAPCWGQWRQREAWRPACPEAPAPCYRSAGPAEGPRDPAGGLSRRWYGPQRAWVRGVPVQSRARGP